MTIVLRIDFDARRIKAVARRTCDLDLRRRLLALAAIYDGSSRADAALIGGVTRQIVRDWVIRFDSGGPASLASRRGGGRPAILRRQHRAWLTDRIAEGPIPELGVVVAWNIDELRDRLRCEFDIEVGRRTMKRELARSGVTEVSPMWSYEAFVSVGTSMSLRTLNRRLKKIGASRQAEETSGATRGAYTGSQRAKERHS
jgi:transposase